MPAPPPPPPPHAAGHGGSSGSMCPLDPPSSPESEPDSPCSDKDSPSGVATSRFRRTLTLYDWDDTFLPSTYLASLGLRIDETTALPFELSQELFDLESVVIKILQEALASGVVKIVTNAEEGWIQLSGSRFMPRLTKFLEQTDVKLVSARTTYEAAYPNAPSSWKIAAFADEVSETYPGVSDLNIIVLGDSLSERDAAHALSSRMPASCIKSVKLVERPSIAQLYRQISLLHSSFKDLREHDGSFDVNLTC
jgi:hypothetical protein